MGVCSHAVERLADGELNVRVHEGRKKMMMMKKHNETISGDVGELVVAHADQRWNRGRHPCKLERGSQGNQTYANRVRKPHPPSFFWKGV